MWINLVLVESLVKSKNLWQESILTIILEKVIIDGSYLKHSF